MLLFSSTMSKKELRPSTLPHEILDDIFLWYADPSVAPVAMQLGSRYVRSKLECANAWNPYHQCNSMCRKLALLKFRHEDVCMDDDYFSSMERKERKLEGERKAQVMKDKMEQIKSLMAQQAFVASGALSSTSTAKVAPIDKNSY